MFQSRKLRHQEAVLDSAETYSAWQTAAHAYDEISGATAWRRRDQTRHYDYTQIRKRLDRLRDLRTKNDAAGLLFALNEGVHGNMGGMGNAKLYTQSLLGTKHLVEDYCSEIAETIRYIADVDPEVIPVEEKYDFYHRASLCFGRSALMFSGGGSLGHFHTGVVKALVQNSLVPHVISGASAGSLVSAIYGTQTPEQMASYFEVDNLVSQNRLLAKNHGKGGSKTFSIEDVTAYIERMLPDMTFQEAYDLTGCYINICGNYSAPSPKFTSFS